MNVANAINGGLWLIFLAYWLISATSTKPTIWRRSDWRFQIGFRIVLIAVVVLISTQPNLWAPILHGRFLPPNARILASGLMICACGLGFAVWARVHLGANWGMPMTVRENPELVTSGPYSLVRHPIYSGVLLAEFGSAFVMGNPWLFVMVVCAPYFAYSATWEEKLMVEEFPDQYPAYKKRTKMIVPFLW